MPKHFGVDFAPLDVPWHRRLQTLAILNAVVSMMVTGWLVLFGLLYLLTTQYYSISLIYAIWWAYDRDSHQRGGWRRKWQWARGGPLWTLIRDYFPISLVKTDELNPEKNYILGVHPHGILTLSTAVTFSSDANHVEQLFPGMRFHTMTLVDMFQLPVAREVCLAGGACSVTKESFEVLLTKSGKGNVLAMVPGGVAEALVANAGSCDLILAKRKGFIRMALKHGADLVPVFSFGETEVYHQCTGPVARWIQNQIKRFTRFVPPIFFGRGVFQYNYGLLPHRRPITLVVGSPIEVEKSLGEPSAEAVDDLHKKYVDSLTKLYETNKEKYGMGKIKLNIT